MKKVEQFLEEYYDETIDYLILFVGIFFAIVLISIPLACSIMFSSGLPLWFELLTAPSACATLRVTWAYFKG